ncbi:MAG: DUF559 domain-containing protein [Candidatus Nomurabacteria bacterium]|nr:DUF559 domain-containing protein [Candidatus Nomurabacteria bacterium]
MPGWESSPNDHFYQWLKKELEPAKVEIVKWSGSATEKWVDLVLENYKINRNTIIIGHSLGVAVGMKVIEKLNYKIAGLVSVAGFVEPKFKDHARPFAETFEWKFNFQNIKEKTKFIKILSDKSDYAVSLQQGKILAEELKGQFIEVIANKPHFCGKAEQAILNSILKENTYPLTPSQREGEFGYHTTDPKTWKALQDRVLEMRNNPTQAEDKLWQSLRKNLTGYHFRRQHIIDRFIVDFVCVEKKLVIEIDGDIHDYKKTEDEERTKILNQLGFGVLRFLNNEVIKNKENVLKKIILKLNSVSNTLSFGEGQGGVFVEDLGEIKVFTTRADTLFGVTYVVLAPEHELISKIKPRITNWAEVEKYIKNSKKKSEIERTDDKKEKTGVELKGIKAINPANNEEVPIWIADYVLLDYGTGAVMAVPQHDNRDKEFSEKYKLPIINKPLVDAQEITKKVDGKMVTKFKLRDWVFSRQRYWGEPIPIINCEKCGLVAVPEKDLPVKLPEVKSYQPTDSGESPLASISKWVNVKCPKCKGPAKRETDTMPNWAGSSWYYLRYADSKNNKVFADKKKLKYWLRPTPNPFRRKGNKDTDFSLSFGEGLGGVDWYNGGMEHTTLHLLYSRFWHKFLYDLKLVPTAEPYKKRTSHGMVLGEGGVKMSKSLGNVINPDDIVKIYGADTLRIYEMFMGPFEDSVAWSTESIIGSRRFVEKVWRIGEKIAKQKNSPLEEYPKGEVEKLSTPAKATPQEGNKILQKLLHKTIKKVSEDIESMRFNTAISAMMILATEMEKSQSRPLGIQKGPALTLEDYEKFLKILSPFAPHIAEEIWANLGNKKSISFSSWPKWDESLVKDQEIKIAVQINGKVRTEILIQANDSEEDVKKKALTNQTVLRYTMNKTPQKIIYVKNRVINILC